MQTSKGFTALGADTIAPLVARGVLLDVAGALGVERLSDGHSVSLEELRRAAEGIELRAGDAVLVRLGSGAVFGGPGRLRGGGRRVGRGFGVDRRARAAAGRRGQPRLGRAGVVDEGTGTTLPGHVHLLVRDGIYIVESLNLEALAADGVREFAFVCLPLKLRGGTGSPVRPSRSSDSRNVPDFSDEHVAGGVGDHQLGAAGDGGRLRGHAAGPEDRDLALADLDRVAVVGRREVAIPSSAGSPACTGAPWTSG